MNKLKKFLLENKVLLFLAVILIIWLTVFIIIIIVFFYGTSDSVYGQRLDKLKDVPISENLQKDIVTSLENENIIDKVTFNIKGDTIYINVSATEGVKISDVESKLENSITLFSESILKVYNIHFIAKITKDEKGKGYNVFGTKNANGSEKIVWNEYSLEESSAQ